MMEEIVTSVRSVSVQGPTLDWFSAFWARPFVSLLVYLMAIDICTGVVKGGIKGKLSSQLSFKGTFGKVQILLMVVTGMLIEQLIPLQWGSFIAGLYSVTEAISIIENVEACGVPVPRVFKRALDRWREEKQADLDAEHKPIVNLEVHSNTAVIKEDGKTVVVEASKKDSKHKEPKDKYTERYEKREAKQKAREEQAPEGSQPVDKRDDKQE